MEAEELLDDQWPYVLSLLPPDLEQTAWENDALIRKRVIKSAANLLRLVLVYGWAGFSARSTCIWAAMKKIGKLSNVALLERLQYCAPWLAVVVSQVLQRNCEKLAFSINGRSIRLVDASCICRAGAKGTDRRLHLSFKLGSMAIDSVQFTDSKGGETLGRYPVAAGDIVVGDRGYAHRKGVKSVVERGADVLIRFNWQNFPLIRRDGKPFKLLEHLRKLKNDQVGDWQVKTAPCGDAPAIEGRVIALKKSPQASEKEQKKVQNQAKKKKRTADQRTIESASYIFVFTTLTSDIASASEILEMYRFRWQIELVFKRLKGLLKLDNIPKCSDDLLDTILLSRILGALLIDNLLYQAEAFSPWGYGLPASFEYVASGDGYDGVSDTGGIGLLQSDTVVERWQEAAGALQGYSAQTQEPEPECPGVC